MSFKQFKVGYVFYCNVASFISPINYQRKHCNVIIIMSFHNPDVKQPSANAKASASNEIKTYALLVTRKH